MSEDDDWFERALHEDDAETDRDDADADGAEPNAGDSRSDDAERDAAEQDGRGSDGRERGGFDGAPDYDADERHSSGNPTTSDNAGDAEFGGADRSDAGLGATDEDEGDDLFDDDFATAFENAPGGGGFGGGEDDGGSATDGRDGTDGGFGAGDSGGFDAGGGDLDAGGDFGADDEGFGGGFGDSGDSFEDEEFESDIPRIDVGIEGLDSMIQGGVPERSLITTIGSAGTGKTTFGLQFLHEALENGENAVFITLEESHDRIVSTATEKGWEFDDYEEEGSLAVIDLDPIEMANSLTSIRNDLPRLVDEFGATRLVLDSVSLLEMMYDDQATRRNEVYDFTKSLKQAGVTTMLTSEASEDNPYASRHGIIEYLVDAVFVLRYIRSSDDFRETRLAVEIQKIRDANHSREIKPYSITNEGISVYRQANIF